MIEKTMSDSKNKLDWKDSILPRFTQSFENLRLSSLDLPHLNHYLDIDLKQYDVEALKQTENMTSLEKAQIQIILAGTSTEPQDAIRHLESAIVFSQACKINDTKCRYLAYCHAHLLKIKKTDLDKHLAEIIIFYANISEKSNIDYAFILELLEQHILSNPNHISIYREAWQNLFDNIYFMLEDPSHYSKFIFFSQYLPAKHSIGYLFKLLDLQLNSLQYRAAQKFLLKKIQELCHTNFFWRKNPEHIYAWLNTANLNFDIQYCLSFILLENLRKNNFPAYTAQQTKHTVLRKLITTLKGRQLSHQQIARYLQEIIAEAKQSFQLISCLDIQELKEHPLLSRHILLALLSEIFGNKSVNNILDYSLSLIILDLLKGKKRCDNPIFHKACKILPPEQAKEIRTLQAALHQFNSLPNDQSEKYVACVSKALTALINLGQGNHPLFHRLILYIDNGSYKAIRRYYSLHAKLSICREIKDSVLAFIRSVNKDTLIKIITLEKFPNILNILFARTIIKHSILPAQFLFSKQNTFFKTVENNHQVFLQTLAEEKWCHENKSIDGIDIFYIHAKTPAIQNKPCIIYFNPNSCVYQAQTSCYAYLAKQLDTKVIVSNYPGSGNSESILHSTQDIIESGVQIVLNTIKENPAAISYTLAGHSIGGWCATAIIKKLNTMQEVEPILKEKTILIINDRSFSSGADYVEDYMYHSLPQLWILTLIVVKTIKYLFIAFSALINIKLNAEDAWREIPAKNKLCLVSRHDEIIGYSQSALYRKLPEHEQQQALHIKAPLGHSQHSAHLANMELENGTNLDLMQKIKNFIHLELTPALNPALRCRDSIGCQVSDNSLTRRRNIQTQ